jgi:hypothetical protein
VDNLWVQPLDGSAGHQITNFASDQIDCFLWSPDGQEQFCCKNQSRKDADPDIPILKEAKAEYAKLQ